MTLIYMRDTNFIVTLKQGGVGVMPTDTIYGLVASAFDKKAVLRVYKLKKRSSGKPFIILISDVSELAMFGVDTDNNLKKVLRKIWRGQVSVVLPCPNIKKELSYLKPKDKTLAFRCPKDKWLRDFLRETGPIIAPTANPEGAPPAQTIKQAKAYFNDKVDFYWDKGELKAEPSTLISFENGKVKVLRQGAVKITNF